MSIPARIKGSDEGGQTTEVAVTREGAIYVVAREPIAVELPQEVLTRRKVFQDYLRVGGVPTGSQDLHLADGSVTPVDFEVKAAANEVRWITQLRILIEGTNFDISSSGDFRRFGSVASSPGLTNGIELYAVQGGLTTNLFLEPVQTMGDFFNYQTGYENFSNAVTAQADFLSVDRILPYEVVLPLGVEDKIVCRINDDMVDSNFLKMNVIVSGSREVV
jgi:hypothetical protein